MVQSTFSDRGPGEGNGEGRLLSTQRDILRGRAEEVRVHLRQARAGDTLPARAPAGARDGVLAAPLPAGHRGRPGRAHLPGHLHGAVRGGDEAQAGAVRRDGAEPLQRHPAAGPLQRRRHHVEPQHARAAGADAVPPRPRQVDGGGPRRKLHDHRRDRLSGEGVGRADVQAGAPVLHRDARHLHVPLAEGAPGRCLRTARAGVEGCAAVEAEVALHDPSPPTWRTSAVRAILPV
mmetsp:Transcript_20412/g.44654  ORF Transcript_20412/g.44654 Transcript_20412/m.44654 type:complete len:234 (-) Transcript_20412:869-1570(-)